MPFHPAQKGIFASGSARVEPAPNSFSPAVAAYARGSVKLVPSARDSGPYAAGGMLADSETFAADALAATRTYFDARAADPSLMLPTLVALVAVNGDPTVTAGLTSVNGAEDDDLVFSLANANQILVDDPDGDPLTVTLTVLNGVLSLSQTTGLTFGDGGGTEDVTMTFTGSKADVNAALEGLVYRGNLNFEGADQLTVAIDDGAGGSAGETIAITLADDGTIDGTPGDDLDLDGTVGTDIFDLGQGGDDEADGLGGNDGFYMAGALSALDDLDGGAGSNDQLILQGNVSATILSNHLQGIEVISLLSGHEDRFGDTSDSDYDYGIVMADAAVDSGERLKIWFAGLEADEDVVFDGSAESDGHFTFYAGMGTDHLIGGTGNDFFFFGDDRFTADDQVDGSSGVQDQLGLRGDYFSVPLFFAADTISDIDTIVLISASDSSYGPPGGTYAYDITLDDENLEAGATMSIWGLNLQPTETLWFDGSYELDGHFRIFGGGCDDLLIGGAQADMLYGALGEDDLFGGDGDDRFVYRSTADSNDLSIDIIYDFSTGADRIDLSAIDADDGVAGNQAFAFIGEAVFSSTAGEVRIVDEGFGAWTVEADVDGDGVADLLIGVISCGCDPLMETDFVL